MKFDADMVYISAEPVRYQFMKVLWALLLLVFSFASSFAQEEEKTSTDDPPEERFTSDMPISLDFEKEEEPISTDKKKKPKKKVFYGIKTKKGFTRKGYGERVTYELFYY